MIRRLPLVVVLAGAFSLGAYLLAWWAYRGIGKVWP